MTFSPKGSNQNNLFQACKPCFSDYSYCQHLLQQQRQQKQFWDRESQSSPICLSNGWILYKINTECQPECKGFPLNLYKSNFTAFLPSIKAKSEDIIQRIWN